MKLKLMLAGLRGFDMGNRLASAAAKTRAPLTAAGILAAGLAGAPAQATLYDWTADIPIIGGGAIVGMGQLTIGAGNLVTQISGTYGAATINGLAPVGTINGGTATGNDNLAFFPAAPTFLDPSGLGFDVNKDPGAGEGTVVNIFSTTSGGYTDNGSTLISGTGFTLTPEVSPIPGPVIGAGLPGIIVACGFLFGLNRRLRRCLSPRHGP